MPRLAVLVLLVPTVASAQFGFIKKIFKGGDNGPSEKISWSCPQSDFDGISQLRSSAEVSLSFEEKDGKVSLDLDPAIFKKRPTRSDLGIDYSSCLEDFRASAIAKLQELRATHCAQGTDRLCKKLPPDVSSLLDDELQRGYFATAPAVKLPRILPGEKSFKVSEPQVLLQNFCSGEDVDQLALFSGAVMEHARTGACPEKYTEALKTYTTELKAKSCATPSELCSNLSSQVDESLAVYTGEARPTPNSSAQKTMPSTGFTLTAPTAAETEAAEKRLRDQIAASATCDRPLMDAFMKTIRFPEVQSKYLRSVKEKFDDQCLERALGSVVTLSALPHVYPERDPKLNDHCKGKPEEAVCKLLASRQKAFEQNIRNFLAVMNNTEAARDWAQVTCDEPTTTLADLIKRIEGYRDALVCVDLKDKDAVVVKSNGTRSPTGLQGNYTIKQNSKDNHDIILTMDISGESEGVGPVAMKQKINECLVKINPYLKGPQGQQLNLKIYDVNLDATELGTLPKAEIPVTNPLSIRDRSYFEANGTGADSRNYPPNIGCGTITHEVLHLLGLCDEYKDDKRGKCRAPATTDGSIMGGGGGLDQVMPYTISCKCPAGSAVCPEIFASKDEKLQQFFVLPGFENVSNHEFRARFCKFGPDVDSGKGWSDLRADPQKFEVSLDLETELRLKQRYLGAGLKVRTKEFSCSCAGADDPSFCKKYLARAKVALSEVRPGYQSKNPSCPNFTNGNIQGMKEGKLPDDKAFLYQGDELRISSKPAKTSILLPAHYERIVGGNCSGKAREYNECSRWAYQMDNCEARPAICNDPDKYMGVAQ